MIYAGTRAVWLFAFVALLLDGCQLVGPDERGLSITTDRQQYAIGEVMTFTVHNGGRAVYANHCCGRPFVGLDVLERGGAWNEVFPPTNGCNAYCDGRPMLIEPGFVYRDRFTFRGAGRYQMRMLFGVIRSSNQMTESIVSDEFEVIR